MTTGGCHRRRQLGQGSLEWIAMLLLAGTLVVGTLVAFQHERVERAAAVAVCRIVSAMPGGAGATGCGALTGGQNGGPDGGQSSTDPDDDPYDDPWYCDAFGIGCYSPSSEGGDPQPEDAPQPWYCNLFGVGCHDTADTDSVDIPAGLDRDSALVQQLLATERGRETLQWLADHHIPVVISPNAKGAYWDGTQMVIGKGYDDPSVIVHETNHAMATVNGTSADASTQGRDDFVRTAINEEVAGTVKQIQAAKELRATGRDVDEQPLERWFDQAYGDAKDHGANDADALAAATAAVSKQFFDGKVRTSTDNKPYTDYYGDYWDSVH